MTLPNNRNTIDLDELSVNSYYDAFMSSANQLLKHNDLSLLDTIIQEWHAYPTLNVCIDSWNEHTREDTRSTFLLLHTMCFNVRGLNHRWDEVVLLCTIYALDVVILTEVGQFDHDLIAMTFNNYRSFYQAGENRCGGVLILVRHGLDASRIVCPIANVCVVDVHLEENVRFIGMYAPDSKTWKWKDLTQNINDHCMIVGDFNIDLDEDATEAENLMDWAEEHELTPCLPSTRTSLRSQRIIDYALSKGVEMSIQTHEGSTTSDHKPIICTISSERKEETVGKRTNWTVYSLVLSYTYSFWEKQWQYECYEETYSSFVKFLTSLMGRCTCYFARTKARIALPNEILKLVVKSRALSFKARRSSDYLLKQEAGLLRSKARSALRKFRYDQLVKRIESRHDSAGGSQQFWCHTRKYFRNASSSLHGIILPSERRTKDPKEMADAIAIHYQQLFEEPMVFRPHPYVDMPPVMWDNAGERIKPITYFEIIKILDKRKKKKSQDAHGLSPYLLDHIPRHYWHLLIRLFNHSLENAFMPSRWKDIRMVILAKKESICRPMDTRPISLLDSFLKVLERAFLDRFLLILNDRGILPDTQSGFRPKHRLQTRVLLFIDQVCSMMSNSSPVTTVFVDFKSAFDQIWFDGCVAKLNRVGIPLAYTRWIEEWLKNRRAFVEVADRRSNWFPIKRGGPQGSSLTPSIFITYHSDMGDCLPMALSSFFADDLAAVMAGQIGMNFTVQCLDVEKRLQSFFDALEFYAILSVQPINYDKTKILFSARAVAPPKKMPVLTCGGNEIGWIKEYKYLGYWISQKIGWSLLIKKQTQKIRQRLTVVKWCKFSGISSVKLRRILFSAYVQPLFIWLFSVFPLFTTTQQDALRHLHFVCLKKIYKCVQWEDFTFSALYQEQSLDHYAYKYWHKYLKSLYDTNDGKQILIHDEILSHRAKWWEGESTIMSLRRNKRLVEYESVFSRCLTWFEKQTDQTIPLYPDYDLQAFRHHTETF